jgi:hypothetical protein
LYGVLYNGRRVEQVSKSKRIAKRRRLTMDDKSKVERSAEEVAWDQEFSDTKDNSAPSTLRNLARLAISVPVAIIRMPMAMLPAETARHTRAAARESFLAVRSLLSAIGDRIEDALSEPGTAGVSGPPGTWGTARTSSTSSTSSKAKRIAIEETAVEVPDTSASGMESEEGRGLRADIEY